MRFWTTIVAGLGAASVAVADHVTKLDSAAFDEIVKTPNGRPVMVKFYAPWCGHCKRLAPDYEAAAVALEPLDITLAKVDCTEEKDLCLSQGVQGYPTLMIYKNEIGKPFTTSRHPQDIIKTMRREAGDFIEYGNADNMDKFKEKISFMLYHDKDDEKLVEKLVEVAKEVDNLSYNFVSVTEPGLIEADGVKVPALVGYKNFQTRKQVYDGKLDDLKALEEFVTEFAHREVGEINESTYSEYMSSGIPLGYIFTPMSESVSWVDGLAETAKKYRGKLNLAILDSGRFGKHAPNLNLKEEFPAFAIQDVKAHAKFPFPQDKELTVESLVKFVDQYIAGDVEAKFKSEELPTEQEQAETAVTIIVQKSFDELVMKNDKNVLVEYYSPQCGHCKNLEPTYEALAAKYKAHPKGGNVVIAKINAVANDIVADIQGFPTLIYYPVGHKDKPLTYQGARTAEDIAQFLTVGDDVVNPYNEESEASKEEDADKKDEAPASESAADEKPKETGKAADKEKTVHDEL